MFFRETRVLWAVNRVLSHEAHIRGYRDKRLVHMAMNPPYPGSVPFGQRAHVYRRRSATDAALMLLLEYAGEWRALQKYPSSEVQPANAAQYAEIAKSAALVLAEIVWSNDKDIEEHVDEAVEVHFKRVLPEVRPSSRLTV